MKILIAGDSFAADYTKKYPDRLGWPNFLAHTHDVTNLAQAGCSEYKIYQQLVNQDLDQFDVILICHTSPYRLHTLHHPAHHDDILHGHSDFIYSDLKNHAANHTELACVVEFFERYFDLDHATFVHNLICEKIQNMVKCSPARVWHITSLDYENLFRFENHLDFYPLFKSNRGDANHFDSTANHHIYNTIQKLLDQKDH